LKVIYEGAVEKPSTAYLTGLHRLPRFLSGPSNGKAVL